MPWPNHVRCYRSYSSVALRWPGYNRRIRCYAGSVRFFVALIMSVMLLTSLGIGSAARAADPSCCMGSVAASAVVDQDGCGAKAADGDKNCPHAGACHSHHVAATADAHIVVQPRRLVGSPAVAAVTPLASVALESSLRPPKA